MPYTGILLGKLFTTKIVSEKALVFLIVNDSDLTYTIGTLDVFGEADKITAICLGDRSSNDVGGEESQHADEEAKLHGDCSMYK